MFEVHNIEGIHRFVLFINSMICIIDINECEDKDLCHPHMCQNVMGSYQCRCSHGYRKLSETSNTCYGKKQCVRGGNSINSHPTNICIYKYLSFYKI